MLLRTRRGDPLARARAYLNAAEDSPPAEAATYLERGISVVDGLEGQVDSDQADELKQDLLHALVLVDFKLGRFDEAIDHCSTLVVIDPDDFEAYFRRGQARIAVGLLVPGFEDFGAAQQIFPTSDDLQAALEQLQDLVEEAEAAANAPGGARRNPSAAVTAYARNLRTSDLERLDTGNGSGTAPARADQEKGRIRFDEEHHAPVPPASSITRRILKRSIGQSGAYPCNVGQGYNDYGKVGFSGTEKGFVGANFLPGVKKSTVAQHTDRVYGGQYSEDGSMFLAACQDQNIRIYDTSAGPKLDKTGKPRFNLKKTIQARNMRWTVTDTNLSPDGAHMIYSTMSNLIHLANIHGEYDTQKPLDISGRRGGGGGRFGVLSACFFGGSGHQIVAGTNDQSLYVFHVEREEVVTHIPEAHNDDINSVTFADKTSNILFSAGDDAMCKVWDQRLLGSDNKPQGTLSGHVEGLTYVSSKGDGVHLITNGKDQTLKYWDLRKMKGSDTGARVHNRGILKDNWDYRWASYHSNAGSPVHPNDLSVATFIGHDVLQTLIRCRFSPMHTTGQRYAYTGSTDGSVVIYDLVTGKMLPPLRGLHRAAVRDVSWHPYQPMIATASWDGTCGLFEFGRTTTGAPKSAWSGTAASS